jgi:hypothetical protein
MRERREAWYRNPFRLGGAGLVVLLAGYGLQMAGEGQPTAAATVAGRLAFLAGLLTVLAAGVVWFLDARAPEPPPDEDEETPDETDEDVGLE